MPYAACTTSPCGRFLAIPIRGAKLCVFAYINPDGYPCCPPTNTDGTPLLKIRFVFVFWVSYSGLVYSYRNPIFNVVVGVICQLSSANASQPQFRKSICGIPACRCFTVGRLSSMLANPEPLPSLNPNSVVYPLVYW